MSDQGIEKRYGLAVWETAGCMLEILKITADAEIRICAAVSCLLPLRPSLLPSPGLRIHALSFGASVDVLSTRHKVVGLAPWGGR